MSITVMKQALEALEAMANEGWLLCGPEGLDNAQTKCVEAITSLRQAIAEAEKQEPDDLTIAYMAGLNRGKDLAPQPAQKPLTDEQIGAILEGVNAYGTRLYTFARAIEAAHGIKGEA